jgi:hypothetical protein
MISNGKTLETISYGAAPCSCRLLLPSSSGFQARILDGALGSLEETFAISPAEPRPDDQVSIAARDPSEPAAKGPLFPFVDLRGYRHWVSCEEEQSTSLHQVVLLHRLHPKQRLCRATEVSPL